MESIDGHRKYLEEMLADCGVLENHRDPRANARDVMYEIGHTIDVMKADNIYPAYILDVVSETCKKAWAKSKEATDKDAGY